MQTRNSFFLPIVVVCLALFAHAAFGFTVTNTSDSGAGSLRQAIVDANAAGAGTQTITFDAGVFTSANPRIIYLNFSLPDVTCNLQLNGPGANALTIYGSSGSRILKTTAGTTVSVSGLRFANGVVLGTAGTDGVNVGTPPTAGGDAQGGAIFNAGNLAVTECLFQDNRANGGNGGTAAGNIAQSGAAGGTGLGGAIYSTTGTLTIVRCTFQGNGTQGGSGGGGANIINGGGGSGNGAPAGHARGGAVYVASGSATVLTSTFISNTCQGGNGGNGGAANFSGAENPGGAGGDAEGGAIYGDQAVTLTSCTVANNIATAGYGGYQTDFSQLAPSGVIRGGGVFVTVTSNVGNTIVANNFTSTPFYSYTRSDVFGTVISQDFNLIGASDGSAGFTGAADQTGTLASPLAAKLDSMGLQDNGGPVPTIRIVKGSPAADKGKDLLVVGTDQRGLTRPVNLADGQFPNASGGDGSDIGAFESQTVPNSRPVAVNGYVSGTKDTALSGQVVQGSDGDNDTLTFSLVSGTMPPGVTLNSDGTVTGTPTATSSATVTFKANDGIEDSAEATLEFDIREVPSLVVNTASDVSDAYDDFMTLREALTYAATLGGTQDITFDATVFATPQTIVLGSQIQTSNSFTLTGPAVGVTIDGGGNRNLFEVQGGTVSFSKILFARGFRSSGGGAVTVNVGATVNVSSCTMTGCGPTSPFVISAVGGAVRNLGGVLALTNCTLAGNGGSGAGAFGGAIYQDGGSTSVLNCTITDNRSFSSIVGGTGSGGGIAIAGGTLSLGNSIVSGNSADTAPDISGTFTSLGFNLIGDTTGATFTPDATDQIGADAKLDETGLGYNGGPVQTVAIFSGSAALDKGKALGGATTDARGLGRTFDNGTIANATGGDGTDIGAFEAGAAAPEIAVENYDSETDLLNGSTRDIGNVDVGVSTSVNFTVRNKGGATLNLTGNPVVAISGANAGEFSVGQPPLQLGAETSENFTVLFNPTSVGAKSATLTITSDDADEGTFTIVLAATAQDTLTAPPTITSPVNNGAVYPMAAVSFIIPEAALSGTVKLTFDNGTAYEFTLDAANETAGNHSVTLDTAAAGMTPGDYSLSLFYQDAAGHSAAGTTLTTVHVRPASAVNAKLLTAGGAASDAAPGAGVFPGLPADAKLASFNPPAIDDAGNIAFLAKWTSVTGPVKKGAGLFLNSTCLGIVGGDASAVAAGATWKSFTDPVVSGGHVVCIATLSAVKTGTSAIVGNLTGAGLELIARAGDPATDVGNATFKTFKAVTVQVVGPAPRVVFLAQLTAGTGNPKVTAANDTGIWFYEPGNPLFVLREGDFVGDPVAGHKIKTLVSFLPGNGSPGCGRGILTNNNGDPIVTALALFTDKTQGLIAQNIDDGPPNLMLSLSGDAATGVNNGATFASYGVPARNDTQTAAFLGKLTIANGVTKADASGIFTGPEMDGRFRTVIRTGVNASQAGSGAKFGVLKDPVLSDDGDIAFFATVKGGTVKGTAAQTLWWKQASQPLQLLAQGGARPGPDLPADAQWKAFTSLAIAGGGRGPIFAATLVPGKGGVLKSAASGVWACDFTGAVRTLFRTGDKIAIDADPLHDKTLKSFTVLKASVGSTGATRSFNNAAQVVWLATFTDKSQAIVTTEVP